MTGAQRRSLPGGRWIFQHGPIDCVIGAEGSPAAVAAALDAAWRRFQCVLDELVAELPLLRANLAEPSHADIVVQGPVARRMLAACQPYAMQGHFITAMAAVAGSVAQELIAFFERPGIRRAYVNNGGDIALHLIAGESFEVGLIIDPQQLPVGVDGRFRIDAESRVRGIATSGWRGRSLSLGIADSVTVLAASAAQADAAATMIANAVNVEHAAIVRAPANQMRDDSDLGALAVTVGVPPLPAACVKAALDAGAVCAAREVQAARVLGAHLCLQQQARRCLPSGLTPEPVRRAGLILQLESARV